MDWGNVVIDSIEKTDNKVLSLKGHLHLEGDFKKVLIIEILNNYLLDPPEVNLAQCS